MADRQSNFDGFVALGCVIRGETTHYDTVCNDSSRGLMLLGLQGLAIGNGILTVETRDQAEVRADPADQNKGGGAAAAALHLIALRRKWGTRPRKPVGFRPARRDQARRRPGRRVRRHEPVGQPEAQMRSAARLFAVQALFQMEAERPDRRPTSSASSKTTASARTSTRTRWPRATSTCSGG